uniref:Uncharacterized protein AlNc14C100G6018 n=1 Tax=Albugo laibachii Nc14 TaxID=890382 RepID=F0WHF5_9STRA|nr:conserved hypothetical protein [Albugo laibachii Nc14]|eukprot:CCA20674.1 conserved hypothetical protein [Albugo laibachii Nc14]
MELARWHFCTINGITEVILKDRCSFIVASCSVRFRYPIPTFSAYEVHTKLAHYDERFSYFIHRFHCPSTGKIYAEGLCRAIVKKQGKDVSPVQLCARIGVDLTTIKAEATPAIVQRFCDWDKVCQSDMEDANRREMESVSKRKSSFADIFTRSINF